MIAPFNFPIALAGGPAAAALVTGNTVVVKCASDTPWAGRLLADCIRDAGLPAGAFNYISARAPAVGEQLVRDPRVAGITFTGSVAVGRAIMAAIAAGRYPRPCIAEMGGKNPCIVTENADLDRAAAGIARSAYRHGRAEVLRAVAALRACEGRGRAARKLEKQIDKIRIGDPTPSARLARAGGEPARIRELRALRSRTRGRRRGDPRAAAAQLTDGVFARGYYVEPVLAEAARGTRSGSTRCSCRS